MKSIITITCCLLLGAFAWAQDPAYPTAPPAPQNITAAEYFIDTDPGIGLGTAIVVAAGVDIAGVAATINTAGLTNGTHRLFIRSRNNEGNWSITGYKEFLYNLDFAYTAPPAALQNVIAAEYFVDTDPGVGMATPVSVAAGVDIANAPATINTASLTNGLHRLFLRTKSNEGSWSVTNIKEFLVDFNPAYPTAPAVVQNIIAAEYFIDTDPGIGNAAGIAVTPGTDIGNILVNPSLVGLSNGTHRLYLRSRNNEGRWSITNIKDFLYDSDPVYAPAPAAPGNVVKAEYFFDTDPGFGNGTSIGITPSTDISNLAFTANTSSLTNGNHTLFIRSLDDWSLTGYNSFLVGTALPLRFLSFAAVNKTTSVELQWKTDNEINTDHFTVERSADGVTFQKIGTITAANSSGTHQYLFADNQPLEKNSYYRLQQVDKDGRFEYSKVLLINRATITGSILFYPNPVKDRINISLPGSSMSRTLSIVDATGNILKRLSINAGVTSMYVVIEQLPAGIYFIKLNDGKEQLVKQFVKE